MEISRIKNKIAISKTAWTRVWTCAVLHYTLQKNLARLCQWTHCTARYTGVGYRRIAVGVVHHPSFVDYVFARLLRVLYRLDDSHQRNVATRDAVWHAATSYYSTASHGLHRCCPSRIWLRKSTAARLSTPKYYPLHRCAPSRGRSGS